MISIGRFSPGFETGYWRCLRSYWYY